MSLMRDPRAPIHVPDDVLAALPQDPSIVGLEQQRSVAESWSLQGPGNRDRSGSATSYCRDWDCPDSAAEYHL